MPSNTAVVFSDVHIGTNVPTTWYQASVHEPYLIAALEWVVQNRQSVQELILLGDLFDLWTYPPATQPPSVGDIIDANPNTLGQGGALANAIAAVPRATYLLGNHDGQPTPADISTIQQSVGNIQLGDPVHVLTGSTGVRTVFSHGHLWTMFNAPDPTSPWNTLPVGHFVTRAFAYQMSNLLKPGQTVADLKNMGAPDGFDLWSFISSIHWYQQFDVAGALLDYCSNVSGMPESLSVVLPDGSVSSIDDAKQKFADLFSRWVTLEGSTSTAIRAAMADAAGQYLAWFAQRLAIQQSADLVVMGHTHTPVGGLTISPTNYINNGFECASIPDTPPKEFTFTVVDLDAATAEIFQVAKGTSGIEISEFPAPALNTVVIPPAMDFSSYVRITNTTSQTLTRTALSSQEGTWVVPPPAMIAPGERIDAWLQDDVGTSGSEGSVSYSGTTFSFSCPTGIFPNTVSGPSFIARTGASGWQSPGQVPRWGHPLQVRYTVS